MPVQSAIAVLPQLSLRFPAGCFMVEAWHPEVLAPSGPFGPGAVMEDDASIEVVLLVRFCDVQAPAAAASDRSAGPVRRHAVRLVQHSPGHVKRLLVPVDVLVIAV